MERPPRMKSCFTRMTCDTGLLTGCPSEATPLVGRGGHPALTLKTHRTCPEDQKHCKNWGAPVPAWPGAPPHGGAPETGPRAEILSALGPGGGGRLKASSRGKWEWSHPPRGSQPSSPSPPSPWLSPPQVWGGGAWNPQKLRHCPGFLSPWALLP